MASLQNKVILITGAANGLGKAYSSSKSAIMGFTHSLKTELSDTHVKVSLVIPPGMNTNLVKNSRHIDDTKRNNEVAFLQKNGMPADEVAKLIITQIKKDKYRIVIGTRTYWIDLYSRLFPTRLHYLISRKKKRIDFV